MEKNHKIARCGLACFLCSENAACKGCHSDGCSGAQWCEVRKCSIEKGVEHCYECAEANACRKGMQSKLKPHAFTMFAQKFGADRLVECLERNRVNGVVYHRNGINGDYDDFSDMNKLIQFISDGRGENNGF